jgi:hypothetical protein
MTHKQQHMIDGDRQEAKKDEQISTINWLVWTGWTLLAFDIAHDKGRLLRPA